MKEAGYTFEVQVLDVEEYVPDHIAVFDAAKYLADIKNKVYRSELRDEIVLTADTVVIIDDEILGKPNNAEEAKSMLTHLSGRQHQVITGVCISSSEASITFQESTLVEFDELTTEEIEYYIKNYQPFDKAGSYGIQEWIGMVGIKSIQGSFYNVMGLPMNKLYQVLKNEFGILPF
jgi:septum formation protein